ncbi:histidine-rich glycoprotein-like [Acipenser oxyrinchus oxyrinchus]|uniref:Histidine-rich glycoprotein-like n=1 Tax=Acipenser oxyrinchus oxyrinchus TaxID=40147 RepID=A0AAD8G3D7_ACIOX|nr:histidine-rich glycoprotein-like [Acipenser oxyrinchus oxyrinchus]
MNLLSFLVVGTLLASTWSLPPTGFPLQTVSCNDTDVESAAALALQSINKEREEGNVLSLFRINVVQKQYWRRGTVFYLAFNVVDTECHVLSRKDYKECEVRYFHEAVYGVCKAMIYIRQGRSGDLLSYNCTLSPVARRKIASVCPDCPPGDSLDKPIYTEIAKLSLSKYNHESNNSKIFALKNITRTSMQSGFGTFYFVEFTVYQTGCTKDNLPEDDICEIVDPFKRYGYCKGSKISTAEDPIVSASCTIYEPEDRREHYHSLTHGREKKHGHGQRCGQGHGQEHGQRHAPDHSQGHGQEHGQRHAPDHSQGHGQEHGQRHAPDHSQGHGQEHGQRHAHGHSQGHGQEHGQRHAHGHSQGHGQEHGQRHAHGHSQGHEQEHGQRHTHGHSQGHKQEHGQRPAHDHSQGHGLSRGGDEGLVEEGLVTESIQERHNDSLEGHGFHVYSRRPVGSVIVLPQSTNQVDLPDPVLSLPEITGPWISNAAILPFPDKSSLECPAKPKLPQLWVLDLLKPIK